MEILPVRDCKYLNLVHKASFCLTQCVNGSSLENIIRGVLEKISRMNILYQRAKISMLQHTCNNGKLIRLINQKNYFLLSRYILVVQWLGIDWPYRIGAIFTRNQRQDAGGGGRTVCQALVWHRAQNRLQCGKHSVRSYTWPEQGRPRVRD